MKTKKFTGNSVEDCLKLASDELGLEINKLSYEILESKGFFKKQVTISVTVSGLNTSNGNDGTITINNGIINVKNPTADGRAAMIKNTKDTRVLINDEEINTWTEVYEGSKIQVIFDESIAKRNVDIKISEDRTKAYLSISYIAQKIYQIKDEKESNRIEIKSIIKEQKNPPKFSYNEIKEQLMQNNVIYGIIEENLRKCIEEDEIKSLLIAKGKEVIDDTNDELEIKYNEIKTKFKEDNNGNIDYRAMKNLSNVKKGDILVILKKGQQGEDGFDVSGKIVRHKVAKKIYLKAGDGCTIENDTIVKATIDGKPYKVGTTFSVRQVHEINGNVDLKTGNIKFNGDVIIYGAVMEGMKVEAEKGIEIYKNVARAELNAKADVDIYANVISSVVTAGGEDVEKISYLKKLNKLHESIIILKETGIQVKQNNLVGRKVRDGEIAKILMENKFKNIENLIQKISMQCLKRQEKKFELAYMIKKMLTGYGVLEIDSFNDFDKVIDVLGDEIQKISNEETTTPVDINIFYSQDSNIKSSGNVYFTGKGEYVSNVTANDGVYFTGNKSVARGGIIKAKNEIRCKYIGSEGGVSTKIMVEKDGHIWADVVYQNTRFVLGAQEYLVEKPCKDVHAYIREDGELIIDKFIL